MNRTILIVICDFLLVTLVAFSNFDAEEAPKAETRVMTGSKPVGGNADMVGTLKIALEDEKQSRDKLTQDLRAQEQAVAEREQRIKEFQANLRKTEAQARQIEEQRSALAQQFASVQTDLKNVQGRLTAASTENVLSKEKLQALEADLKRREQEALALQQKLTETEKAAQATLAEKQQIAARLQVSEAEKNLTREQVAELRSTVAAERQDKAKLQAHASTLATNVAFFSTARQHCGPSVSTVMCCASTAASLRTYRSSCWTGNSSSLAICLDGRRRMATGASGLPTSKREKDRAKAHWQPVSE